MFDYQWPSAYTIKPDFVRSKINHNSFKYLKEIEHFFRKISIRKIVPIGKSSNCSNPQIPSD